MLSKLLYSASKKASICKNIYYMMPSDNASFSLQSKILEFDQVFNDKGSKGVVDIIFYITNEEGSVVSQKEFKVEKSSPSNNAKGGVVALNQAAKDIVKKAVVWMGAQLSSR
jgi:ABC-type uncharacterized transport system auxiliary subunit